MIAWAFLGPHGGPWRVGLVPRTPEEPARVGVSSSEKSSRLDRKLDDSGTERIGSVPDLVGKEGLAMLFCSVAIGLVAALYDAPTDGPADTQGIPPEYVKAPWIFVGIQVMLRDLPPGIGGIALPLAALLLVALAPWFPHAGQAGRIARSVVFWGLCMGAWALTAWGLWR